MQEEGSAEVSATNIDSTNPSKAESETLSSENYTQISLSPATLSALESGKTFKPGTYTGNATATNKGNDDWSAYAVAVNVVIDDQGRISQVAVTDESYSSAAADSEDNETYLENAELGTRKAKGIAAQVVENQGVEGVTAVSGATYSSAALIEAVADALSKAVAEDPNEYVYLYAALTYGEYYAAENVMAAGSVAAGAQVDTHNETDTGAFDAVSRATTNHGLHRGSYQNTSVIYGESGATYRVNAWNSGTEAVLEDGTVITFSRGAITAGEASDVMDHYEVLGFKYVPVAVKAADLDDFKAAYTVVENGGMLVGGYSEQQLSSYNVVASVDENTNGLKIATKNEGDGTFSFSKRQAGATSGVKDAALKTASQADLGVTTKDVKSGKALAGSYGDFLRVDLKSNYGDLGANMQAVIWEYYGSGDTVLATYGTKFAADNWMHKSNGIQLGLTESARCALPEGTDGTGAWKVTICALGYEDVVLNLNVDESDINMAHVVSSTADLEKAIATASALSESSYTAESWAAFVVELGEAQEQLALAQQGATKTTQEAVDEATDHLNDAMANLVYQAAFATWAQRYADLGVDTASGYDAVSSATNFTSFHAKDIPANVERATDEEGTVTLTGVNMTPKEKTVTPVVASSSFAYSNSYGTGEFVVMPDDTVEGYVWNDYLNAITAITISDGTTTVGALPWVDYYGENATSGPHYNKIEIAVNNGESVGSNKADVTRFAAFYEEGSSQIKAGTYTVTVYADGYETISTDIPVLPTYTGAVTCATTSADTSAVKISGLPNGRGAAALENATATVYVKVGAGRGAKTYYYAQNAAIASNGIVALTAPELPEGTEVTKLDVTINSSNYAPINAVASVGQKTSFKDLYATLGADASASEYDAVSSATNFASFHVGDIPSAYSWAATETEQGVDYSLDGVILSSKEATKSATLSQAYYDYNPGKVYGTGDFNLKFSGYQGDGASWKDFWTSVYAATISDGTTTAAVLPWIDLYAEGSKTGSVQISMNKGVSLGSNAASVSRYDAFYEEGASEIKAGTYTVKLYSEGYEPVVATVEVLSTYEQAISARSVHDGMGVSLANLPEDIADVTTTVSYKVGEGRGAKTFYLAQNEPLVDGKVRLSEEMAVGTTYTITVNSSNYAPMLASLTQQAAIPLVLDLSSDVTSLKVGDTLKAQISLRGDLITTAQGALAYDHEVLRLVGFDTQNSRLSDVDKFHGDENGTFSFFGNSADFTEGGVVAEAQFEVVGAGTAAVSLSADAENVGTVEDSVRDHVITAGTQISVEVIAPAATKGDVNNNGKINIVDAQVTYDMATNVYGEDYVDMPLPAGWNLATLRYVADANSDDVIDAVDAFAIQHFVHHQSWE